MSLATPEKIRSLQRKLYRKAKAEPAYRFYVLYDKICREDKGLFGVTDFNNQTARGWAFPPLAECRRAWEARNGGSWPWHRDVIEWQGTKPIKLSLGALDG